MAITFFGVASQPADNASFQTSQKPCVVTPPSNMVSGQLVIALTGESVTNSGGSNPLTMRSGDGQTWTAGVDNQIGHGNRMFWCVFNGSWTQNPACSSTDSSTSALSMILNVFNSDIPNAAWAIDVNESDTNNSAPASPFSVTINGQTPVHPSSMTFAWWFAGAAVQTFTLQTGGWTQPGSAAQWRNTAGSGFSAAYKIQSSVAATGSVNTHMGSSVSCYGNIITFTDGTPPTPPISGGIFVCP
jgi:hypothetical protein